MTTTSHDPRPRHARRLAVFLVLALATALAAHARHRAEPPPPLQAGGVPAHPRIEVAFVLDSTGSMAGLIEGAKRKIWSIVQELAAGQPQPEIRMGLVAYRDRGDAWVTRRFDLTPDLDAFTDPGYALADACAAFADPGDARSDHTPTASAADGDPAAGLRSESEYRWPHRQQDRPAHPKYRRYAHNAFKGDDRLAVEQRRAASSRDGWIDDLDRTGKYDPDHD